MANLLGKRVQHKRCGFEGIVVEEDKSKRETAYKVKITNGEHPVFGDKDEPVFAYERNLCLLPFKVGDIISGTNESPYVWTDGDMKKGEVIEVLYGTEIKIKALEMEIHDSVVGTFYNVDSQYFNLVTPIEDVKIEVGDIVTGLPGNGYGITNDDMTEGEVQKVLGDYIDVKVLKHATKPAWEGDTFTSLRKEDFKIVRKADKVPQEIEVGDVVKALDSADARYGKTNTDMKKALVIKADSDGEIRLKITEHPRSAFVGDEHWVKSEHFEVIEKGKIEVGDIVTGRPSSNDHYGITTTEMYKGKVTATSTHFGEPNITVEILEHADESEVGSSYPVDAKHFKIVEKGTKTSTEVSTEPSTDTEPSVETKTVSVEVPKDLAVELTTDDSEHAAVTLTQPDGTTMDFNTVADFLEVAKVFKA